MMQAASAVPGLYLMTAGNEILAGVGNVDAVVQWLALQDQRISGLEAFATDGRHLDPLLDFIADFSGMAGAAPADTAAAARAMLAEWGNDVEFVAIWFSPA